MRTEKSEVVRRDTRGGERLRKITLRQVDAQRTNIVCGDGFKDAGMISPDDIFRNRDGGLIPYLRGGYELDEPVGFGIWQGFEQYFVDDRKDGGAGTDPQGEDDDGCHGKAEVAAQRARCKAKIVKKARHWRAGTSNSGSSTRHSCGIAKYDESSLQGVRGCPLLVLHFARTGTRAWTYRVVGSRTTVKFRSVTVSLVGAAISAWNFSTIGKDSESYASRTLAAKPSRVPQLCTTTGNKTRWRPLEPNRR